MTEIWAYVRVSTTEQAFGNDQSALIVQMERVKQAGATKIYYDIERRTSDSRKGLGKLIQDIQALPDGKVSKLLFTRLDRVAASPTTFYRLIGELQKKGIEPVAIDDSLDLKSVGGELSADVRLAVSKHEVKMISLRVRKRNEWRRSQRLSHYNAPFGYEARDGIYYFDRTPILCLLETKEEMTEYDITKNIFSFFFEIGSVTATVKYLHQYFGISVAKVDSTDNTDENIISSKESVNIEKLTKNNKTAGLRYPLAGLKWTTTGLKNVLVNPIFAGGIARDTVKEGGVRKPFDEWVIDWGTHDNVYISVAQHYRIKEIIKSNRLNRWSSNTENEPNIFSRLIKCNRCGSTYGLVSRYTSKKTGEKTAYYQCLGYTKHGTCDQSVVITAKEVESQLIPWLTREAERLSRLGEHQEPIVESQELVSLRKQLSALELIANGNPSIERAANEVRQQIAIEFTKCNSQEGYTFAKREFVKMFSDPDFWESLEDLSDKKRLLGECIKQIVVDGRSILHVVLRVVH
jgi:DNA invertase Pin-like site-specific DNA recombinase